MFGLPPTYTSRPKPAYFADTLPESHLWQADVYRLAARLARQAGIRRLVDVGCGRGVKLAALAQEFDIVGLDWGDNLDHCLQTYSWGTWLHADFEREVVPPDLFQAAVVICADVIEHLSDPSALVATLRNACETAAYVLLSTPDRLRLYGHDHPGPPANGAHCREWTNAELTQWLRGEGLSVVWSGWTISFEPNEQHHTSLVILSKRDLPSEIPAAFEPNGNYHSSSSPQPAAHSQRPIRVWMTPTPFEAARDTTNSIHQIVLRLQKHLPPFGVELIEQPATADLRAAHAGQGSREPVDVAHYHGLYNTAGGHTEAGYFAINAAVIANLKTAKEVTAPSNWIADILRRDMHLEPHIIGWGVDTDEWTPGENRGYVLWNKARVDFICDPSPMQWLAERAPTMPFVSTFGQEGLNVKIVGRQPYAVMREIVRGARIYLSTNVETFGIGVLEACAAGVPVLGFRQGAIADYIEHGVHGFLAEPGDLEGLLEGLHYCVKYRKVLGANARSLARQFSWDKVAEWIAQVYREALAAKQDVRPHHIDPALYKGA